MTLNRSAATIAALALAVTLGGCATNQEDLTHYTHRQAELFEFDCHPDIEECKLGPHDQVIPGVGGRRSTYTVRPTGPFGGADYSRGGWVIEGYSY